MSTAKNTLYENSLEGKRQELAGLEATLQELEARDWTEYANGLQEKLFAEFKRLSKFLDLSSSRAVTDMHVSSPIGRVRHLYRVLVGRKSVISAAQRRAQNAPIQGISSEIGSTAGYLILDESDLYITENNLPEDQFPMYCRAVHDANNFVAKYAFIIPMVHIMSHQATTGAVNWYESTFKMKFNVHPEIDLEIGAHDKESRKWDYSMKNLAEIIFKALVDQVEIKKLKASDLPAALKSIYAPWTDLKSRANLQTKYPILGLSNLDPQIDEGIAHARSLLKAWKTQHASIT
jgi:hypothetical protein